MSKPYTSDSIARALTHHESRGALLSVSPPEPGGRKTWRVSLPDYGEPVELTTPQAWALCLGLRASEIVANHQIADMSMNAEQRISDGWEAAKLLAGGAK